MDTTATVDQDSTATVSFGDESGVVFGWFLGRLAPSGAVSCMLFGQFSASEDPPSSGWVTIARNVKQDDVLKAKDGASRISFIFL
jgi:hypothetical protein